MNGSPRLALVLGALLAANLLFDVGLVCYGMRYQPPLPAAGLIRRLQIPVWVIQVLLVGVWLALAEARLWWRLLVAAVAAMGIASSPAWATLIGPKLPPGGSGPVERFVMFTLLYFAILLATAVALLPVRRFGNCRLTSQNLAATSLSRQFQVADVLLWMIPIGGFLAILRLYLSIGRQLGSDPAQFWMLHVEMLALAPLAIAIVYCAFTTRHLRRAAVLLASLTLLIAGGFAVLEYSRLARLLAQLSPTALPFSWIAAHKTRMFWQPLEVLLAFVAASLIGLINCLVLRALGWRLVRPMQQAKDETIPEPPPSR